MAKRKHKHSKYKNTGLLPIVSCTDCDNCLYIGEGDSMCDVYHIIVIEDWTLIKLPCRCPKFIKL